MKSTKKLKQVTFFIALAMNTFIGAAWSKPAPGFNYTSSLLSAPEAVGSDTRLYKVSIYTTPASIGTRDVVPDPDGTVWFNGQWSGVIGHLKPATKEITLYPLGRGSTPHGVILGPDGGLWICDESSNAIRRFDRKTHEVQTFYLPKFPESMGHGNLNTATFDLSGNLWFTAQNGYYGRLNPKSGKAKIFSAPGGFGPYGITTTPKGEVWFSNLAQKYIAKINTEDGSVETVEIPGSNANGSRRIWSDSDGNLWITCWGDGALRSYSPESKQWQFYKLPGLGPRGYSTYVDNKGKIWSSDFGTNSITQFNPKDQSFTVFPGNKQNNQTLQMNGMNNQIWAGQQGVDQVVLFERITQ